MGPQNALVETTSAGYHPVASIRATFFDRRVEIFTPTERNLSRSKSHAGHLGIYYIRRYPDKTLQDKIPTDKIPLDKVLQDIIPQSDKRAKCHQLIICLSFYYVTIIYPFCYGEEVWFLYSVLVFYHNSYKRMVRPFVWLTLWLHFVRRHFVRIRSLDLAPVFRLSLFDVSLCD